MKVHNNKNMRVFLSVLRIIETVYLCTFLFIIYVYALRGDMQVQDTITSMFHLWVRTSMTILPLLLFKNVLVAILNNGILTHKQKTYMLIRCALYVALTVYSYPLVLAL